MLPPSERGTHALPKIDEEYISQLFDNNPGLKQFLSTHPGNDLLLLKEDDFSALVYYTSITREHKQAENIRDFIAEALFTLTHRERRILQLRYGLEDGKSRTFKQVAKEFNISSLNISNIEKKALIKLRHPSRSRKLKDFIESEKDDSEIRLIKAIFGEPPSYFKDIQ